MNAGSISLIFLLGAMTAVMRVIERSWFGAATSFGLYWTAFLGASAVLAPSYILTTSGIAWIVLAYFALIVGSILGRFGSVRGDQRLGVLLQEGREEVKTLGFLIAGGILLALCSMPILTRAAGVSLLDLTTFKALLRVAVYYTSHRYNDPTFREPGLAIALWTFAYLASLLGGRLFVVARGIGAQGLAFVPILVAGMLAMLMTTRALVLLSLLLWISGYIVSKVEGGRQERQLLDGRTVFLAVALCCAAVGLFIVGKIVRGGGADRFSQGQVGADVVSSFLGSASSFTMWFDQTGGGQLDGYGYGARSLSGELEWLLPGFDRADVATFQDTIVGRGSGLEDDTTVATLFREWIYDFSPAGCLVLFALLGFFGARSYAACANRGISRGAGLAAYYFIVFYSMMGFVYKFTTLLAVSVAFGFYCRYLVGRRSSRLIAIRAELAVQPAIASGLKA